MGFNKEVFAARLRGKRAEKGISQAELAVKVGSCSDAISKYESGGYTPGSDKVYLLAEVLGCTPDYLMGWDEQHAATAR